MNRPLLPVLLSSLALAPLAAAAQRTEAATAAAPAAPLVIGETFTMRSAALGEARRINVYFPPWAAPTRERPLPVLYMPDGGIAEDFLHVAGLVQVSAGNGTMRPFLLVGIENTERRRDMTGPTTREDDRKIAPRVGGSAAFRRFVRDELIPEVERRYATTRERAIVGESLAGLFVVETFLLEPDLFDTYIAFDPSLWWNGERLVADAAGLPGARAGAGKTLWLATSGDADLGGAVERLGRALADARAGGPRVHHQPLPDERHATIYHPAALRAFRALFAPAAEDAR
jgi:predicted alpha/beta superfamily hydrolase